MDIPWQRLRACLLDKHVSDMQVVTPVGDCADSGCGGVGGVQALCA